MPAGPGTRYRGRWSRLSYMRPSLLARFGNTKLPNRAAIAHPDTANSPLSVRKNWVNSRRRRVMTPLFRCLLAGLFLLCAALPAAAADLVLKRVVLSTGGVGYLEYEAQVDGNAALPLDVPPDQVDDALKRLVFYDSGGAAGEIPLAGREPLAQSFVDLPFDRAALNSATDLLNALQGAEIRVGAPKAVSGRLLHVDPEELRGAGGIVETRSRVSVLTDAGLTQFLLQDIDAISFADPGLHRPVNTALARLAAYP